MDGLKQQNAMEFGDYIEILFRRKFSFISAFLFVLVIGLVVAFTLPAVYRSEATILIERQEIPQDLVATTVTGYVQERIEGIRQRLVTYDNLVAISEKLDLHPELRQSGDISEMVSQIRKNILVEMVDIKAGSSKKTATVAFTVAYEANSPEIAQKVAAEVANRYLEANKQARSEQAAEVSSFLEQETERLRKEIVELEKALATFKQEQSAQLPELLQINMRLYEKTEEQIEETKDRILKINDQIVALQSELSLTDPYKAVRAADGSIIQSPKERLTTLTSQYIQDSARYAPNHPDMIRLRREIRSLGSQFASTVNMGDLIAQFTQQKSELLDARRKYSKDHPDVLRLEKSVAAIESEIRTAQVSDVTESGVPAVQPDNPRYVSLKTQLTTARSNLKEEQTKLTKYQDKLKDYEKRLFQTPIVERDYQSLTRDYGNAKKKYAELKNKQMEARLAVQLEAGEKGERFVLEGAAFLPTSPERPNRIGIALLSGLLASLAGIIAIAMAEFRDKSVRGVKDISQIFGTSPIVVVPYITNSEDESKKRKKRYFGIVIILVIIVLIIISIVQYLP